MAKGVKKVELHLYRPGEREYVAVYDIVEQKENKIVLRPTHPAQLPVIIKPVNQNGHVHDIDVPQKVMVFTGENDNAPAIGYLRIFGGIIDIVME